MSLKYEPASEPLQDLDAELASMGFATGEDQILLFKVLHLCWTSPESGAKMVEINGLEKDDLISPEGWLDTGPGRRTGLDGIRHRGGPSHPSLPDD